MSESTIERYAESTNGRVPVEEVGKESEPADRHESRGLSSLIVPVALIATGLIVLRRMQRGNFA
jgi:hypothetical protein